MDREVGGKAFVVDWKGENLQNWQAKKYKTIKQTKQQRGFKPLDNLTCFAFMLKIQLKLKFCHQKMKLGLPFKQLSKVFGIECIKKCIEVHNGRWRSQVGPDMHCQGWGGWCVVLGLKLVIIRTWKCVIKSNVCILFARLNSNHILSITKGPNKCPYFMNFV